MGSSRRGLEGGRKKETTVCLLLLGQVSRNDWVSSDYSSAGLPWLLTSGNMASSLDPSGSRGVNNLPLLLMSGLPHHPCFPITRSNTFWTCAPYYISSFEHSMDCVFWLIHSISLFPHVCKEDSNGSNGITLLRRLIHVHKVHDT